MLPSLIGLKNIIDFSCNWSPMIQSYGFSGMVIGFEILIGIFWLDYSSF